MYWTASVYLSALLLLSSLNVNESRRSSLKSTRWWTLAIDSEQPKSYLETNEIMRQTPLEMDSRIRILSKKQKKLVDRNPGALDSVARGAQMAIKECQHQFRNRRWNCPIKKSELGVSVFGKILNIGCRETAFIYAITAASVVHSVAWDCSRGRINTCTCDYRTDEPSGNDWSWGGCSDNVKFGYRFSKKFVDSLERGEDLRYMVNRQNNEAGRRHVVSETTQQCKCHGMSGSCAMQTCWMRLPEFRQVGKSLKERFDGASKVYAGNNWSTNNNRVSSRPARKTGRSTAKTRNSIRNSPQADLDNSGKRMKKKGKRKSLNFMPVDSSHKQPTRKDMVYFEDSPDFCVADKRSSLSEGTTGRQCNATSLGIDGCDLMCCGRGYTEEHYTARERCSCIFKWCCEVICQVCTEQRIRYTCK